MAAKLPNLHRHLQSIGCDMTIIGATDWILCLYTTSLPAEVNRNIAPLVLSQRGIALRHHVALQALPGCYSGCPQYPVTC